MLTIAYLANRYPSPVEPYVGAEIEELRRRGMRVVPGSVWRAANPDPDAIYLMPIGLVLGIRALWLCVWKSSELADLLWRVLFEGREEVLQRVKALVHTWLGACYALRLRHLGVQHIHVHHGYFASWIALVAGRLTGASVSMTLHGSDLLQSATFMDAKLANCVRCFPISEFNRQHILASYSEVPPSRVAVARLGVAGAELPPVPPSSGARLRILCVGRLHTVKDHPFLLRACARLQESGVEFECRLAGSGAERPKLERQIENSGLQGSVKLLGHVPRQLLDAHYEWCDMVVLTSRSEGIPVVLMEAMVKGKIVLAPAITGIPELVRDGETGFLYVPGSLRNFLERIELVRCALAAECLNAPTPDDNNPLPRLEWIRHAARIHVRLNFDQQTNLNHFAGLLESAAISALKRAA